MSRIIVDSIRNSSASSDGITLASDGSVTIPGNATCSGTATGFGIGGKILQVVQTFKRDSFSTSNNYATEITGLNASIAKTSASNKILITVNIGYGRSGRDFTRFYLYEDSAELTAYQGTGGSSGGLFMGDYNHLQSTTEETYSMYNISKTDLDDGQKDTNSHTYKIFGTANGITLYINRRSYSYDWTTTSGITLKEVAA